MQNKLLILAWAVMWIAVSYAITIAIQTTDTAWPLVAFIVPMKVRFRFKV